MRFREFARLDEVRFKGLKRQFVQSNPDMPRYVANDLYNGRIGYSMRRVLSQRAADQTQGVPVDPEAPTIGVIEPNTPSPQSPGSRLPVDTNPATAVSSILSNSRLQGVEWLPRPVTINVSPLDFDEPTLDKMLYRRFGMFEEPEIPNDAARTATQHALMQGRGVGKNEPIIVVWDGRRYKLLEGWHRTMNYLLYDHNDQIGAPPDQIRLLRSGASVNDLDLSRWRRVPILAYVGVRRPAASGAAGPAA